MKPTFFIGREISSETRNWLIQQQVVFEEQPLIRIKFANPDLTEVLAVKSSRKFIVSSNPAAEWLMTNFQNIGFSENDSVFCLSEKQKNHISNFTTNIFVSPIQNAASLVKVALAQNISETSVFLHGNLALDLIPAEIEHSGIPFLKLEVYRNEPVKRKSFNEFDVYLFFSPSGVQSFVDAGNKIPESAKIVAIGPTTAKTCHRFFGGRIYISAVQEELAVVKYAVEIQKQNEFQT